VGTPPSVDAVESSQSPRRRRRSGERQIVIPADAHKAMQIEEGHKVVVLRGPRDGSIIAFRADSLERFDQHVVLVR
jgi:bifunctional DNA-binding transcriptional regulator/antitoxin component of YhaV-PrlF toxin-antitoxin module